MVMDKKKLALIQLLIDRGIFQPTALEELTAPSKPLEINTVGVAVSVTALKEPLWPRGHVMCSTEIFSEEYQERLRKDDKGV